MIDVYEAERSSVIAVMEVPWDQTHKYGIVDLAEGEARGRVRDLIEKPQPGEAPSNLAVVGRYVLEPAIFELLEHAEPGKGGEIQLTDSLQRLNLQSPLTAFRFDGRRYDVGDKLGFVQATIDLALERDDLAADVRAYLLQRLGLFGK
jgi:UTP--glucose-1-phosphate uridylyltransferase